MSHTLSRMDARIHQWQAEADGKAVFLTCYRMMTHNMLVAIEQGEFQNPAWTDRLLHHFSDYYFQALERYENRAADTPAVWRFAFDFAEKQDAAAVQKLLLGVNAHINYDLVLTLRDLLQDEWPNLPEAERLCYYRDYCHVNAIIRSTIDAVQDDVLEPAQPAMRIVDDLMGRMDEWLLGQLVTHWRDNVWKNAGLLLTAVPADAQARVVQNVENRALERAEAIMGKGWPLKIGKIL